MSKLTDPFLSIAVLVLGVGIGLSFGASAEFMIKLFGLIGCASLITVVIGRVAVLKYRSFH